MRIRDCYKINCPENSGVQNFDFQNKQLSMANFPPPFFFFKLCHKTYKQTNKHLNLKVSLSVRKTRRGLG